MKISSFLVFSTKFEYKYDTSTLFAYLSKTTLRDIPFSKHKILLGSVNGLVYLVCMSQKKVVVLNLAIRQVKIINAPLFEDPMSALKVCGFCWDASHNDYKVVVCSGKKEHYICSSNSDSWTILPQFWFHDYFGEPYLILNGVPYCIASRDHPG